MKHPIVYTLLGCTVEIAPGGRTATATHPGGPVRSFRSVPDGASAQVQAQRWIHSLKIAADNAPVVPVAEAATEEPIEIEEEN